MSGLLFVLAIVAYIAQLEVKYRMQQRENDAQKLRGSDDDAS